MARIWLLPTTEQHGVELEQDAALGLLSVAAAVGTGDLPRGVGATDCQWLGFYVTLYGMVHAWCPAPGPHLGVCHALGGERGRPTIESPISPYIALQQRGIGLPRSLVATRTLTRS